METPWAFTRLYLAGLLFSILLTSCTQPSAKTAQVHGNYKIAFGSCIENPMTPIWDTIGRYSPDVMLFLGDNIYLKSRDYGSYEGHMRRYRKLFEAPGMQTLFKNSRVFASWDDHDYGSNNSDSTFSHASLSRAAFVEAWGPSKTPSGLEESIAQSAMLTDDIELLVTDNRSYRVNPKKLSIPQMFGVKQMNWLTERLTKTTAKLVILTSGTQLLCSNDVDECFVQYPNERTQLFAAAVASGAQVLFLSGDAHYGEILTKKIGKKTLVEMTSSPLSGGHTPLNEIPSEPNRQALVTSQDHFGLVTISRAPDSQRFGINLALLDTLGNRLAEYTE